MAILTQNDYIKQIGDVNYSVESFFMSSEGIEVTMGSSVAQICFFTVFTTPGTLLGSNTSYIVSSVQVQSSSQAGYILASVVNMGNLDLSTNVFTSGSALPTRTELGLSAQPTVSPLFAVCTTALNATPGSFTVTYVDQDGNSSETTAAQTCGNSQPINGAGVVLLNGNDWGVRSISSAAQTGGTTPSGVLTFYGIKNFICAGQISPSKITCENNLTLPINPVRLGTSETLAMITRKTGTAHTVTGNIFFVGEP